MQFLSAGTSFYVPGCYCTIWSILCRSSPGLAAWLRDQGLAPGKYRLVWVRAYKAHLFVAGMYHRVSPMRKAITTKWGKQSPRQIVLVRVCLIPVFTRIHPTFWDCTHKNSYILSVRVCQCVSIGKTMDTPLLIDRWPLFLPLKTFMTVTIPYRLEQDSRINKNVCMRLCVYQCVCVWGLSTRRMKTLLSPTLPGVRVRP